MKRSRSEDDFDVVRVLADALAQFAQWSMAQDVAKKVGIYRSRDPAGEPMVSGSAADGAGGAGEAIGARGADGPPSSMQAGAGGAGAVGADCAGVADGPSSWAQYGAGGVGFDDGAGGAHGADGVGGADGPCGCIQGGAGGGEIPPQRVDGVTYVGALNLVTETPWWCHQEDDFADATAGVDVSQPSETALSQVTGAAEWLETLQYEYVEEADGADGAGDAGGVDGVAERGL